MKISFLLIAIISITILRLESVNLDGINSDCLKKVANFAYPSINEIEESVQKLFLATTGDYETVIENPRTVTEILQDFPLGCSFGLVFVNKGIYEKLLNDNDHEVYKKGFLKRLWQAISVVPRPIIIDLLRQEGGLMNDDKNYMQAEYIVGMCRDVYKELGDLINLQNQKVVKSWLKGGVGNKFFNDVVF
jgi:hypothetical protein